MKFQDPMQIIKQEVLKHDYKILDEFMITFPCERKNFFIPIPQPKFKIIFKPRQVGFTLSGYHAIKVFEKSVKNKYVIFADVEDFWKRWNRFQKVRCLV